MQDKKSDEFVNLIERTTLIKQLSLLTAKEAFQK